MQYKPTIGLEIHAELKTKTKMFCNSRNDSEEARPNVNICPVCMGYPGTLPVINKQAVKNVLKIGLAVGGKIADYTEFDRKNYFYPDIPKGYQISQYKYPLVSGGELAGVKLTRIHLEEDTARSTHHSNYSLVDFNRAGVPLMELVTEPVIRSASEAGNFARELQLLLQYLKISDANMEKGEMRVEANISVAPINADLEADHDGLLYKDLTYKIRGAAFNVYNALGSGHKELVYQNALAEEFTKLGISYEKEKNLAVHFNDKKVGSYQPDFVLENKLILEVKALPFVGQREIQQVNYYLRNTNHRLALLINFGGSPIQIERVIYDTARYQLKSAPNRHQSVLGTKVEVKNLNSFRATERAIEYEIKRQTEALENGEEIVQETRGWDESKQVTFSQRSKESSHDYRYFPDPDLPKLVLSELKDFVATIKNELPELPEQKRTRFATTYELKEEDVETYVRDVVLGEFFESTAQALEEADAKVFQLASNYLTSDILGLITKQTGLSVTKEAVGKLSAKEFAKTVKMVAGGELGSRGAKDLITHLVAEGGEAASKAKELNLIQIDDVEVLKVVINKLIERHKSVVSDYKKGKESALQFLIGLAMKATKGSANPQTLKKIFTEELK